MTTKTVQIGYVSETDRDYAEALRKVETLDDLRQVVDFYRPLTNDAIKRVGQMDVSAFDKFQADAKKVSRARGQTAERIVDEWGDIFMPALMLKVSMVATQFHCPFGTAFIRMKEMGKL